MLSVIVSGRCVLGGWKDGMGGWRRLSIGLRLCEDFVLATTFRPTITMLWKAALSGVVLQGYSPIARLEDPISTVLKGVCETDRLFREVRTWRKEVQRVSLQAPRDFGCQELSLMRSIVLGQRLG